MEFFSLVVAAVLAVTHLVAGKLRFLEGTPRSVWLSAAGGVSVAYVFVHILPELADAQEQFRRIREGFLSSFEHHIWLIALLGLVLFYGIERMIRLHRPRHHAASVATAASGVFWIHTGSFAVYNMLFGYLLLHRETPGLTSLAVYGFAIALHFVVTDYGLRLDHQHDYERIVRWFLASAVLVGYGLGNVVEINRLGTSALFAFLAGGIVLNVMKEELPEERKSRFGAFASGAALYTIVLLAS